MIKVQTGQNVFDAAVERIAAKYKEGERLVVAFSGGKDSTCVLEMTILAARAAGKLPVEVVFKDTEILPPGTYEYVHRVAARKDEVKLHWLWSEHFMANAFSREFPLWWTFDHMLKDKWVSTPPEWAEYRDELTMESMVDEKSFPVGDEQNLFSVQGCRAAESKYRKMTVGAWNGSESPNATYYGAASLWPIYDWTDGDVWKAVLDNKWDYNKAYNVMHRMGIPKSRLRIADFSLNNLAAEQLAYIGKAWPEWFTKACDRVPGARHAGMFGAAAFEPDRRSEETWEECFKRTCLKDAPAWISERANKVMEKVLQGHRKHSSSPLPEVTICTACTRNMGAWRTLSRVMYMGDPLGIKCGLPRIDVSKWRKAYEEKHGRS